MASFVPRAICEDNKEPYYGAFHVKCGRNVEFFDSKRTAQGVNSSSTGIVYSAKPIPKGKAFQVKLLQRREDHSTHNNHLCLSYPLVSKFVKV